MTNEQIASANKIGLTETILAIHNEVQSAIDYIDEISSVEPTELGKSSAIMSVERIRIRMPINFETEQKTHEVKPVLERMDHSTIIQNIVKRKGFLIEKGRPGGFGTYTRINVMHPIEQKAELSKEGEKLEKEEVAKSVGEIEIVFIPMGRRK
ncbi:MAG: hypothetical protein CVT88_06920 [Candidatus Altiarchaeales archaeon HGW-Altiarchaeales-1]|nr:MAG: hypothetical protein CVT88_06920 [Candidatus Altiarchaeales archaeon HGW-Altiarchaeales-1]